MFAIAVPTMAQQISEQAALEKARAFFQQSITASGQTIRRAPRKAPRLKAAVTGSEYYIFNDEANQDFVIISGDERTPDILGYSDEKYQWAVKYEKQVWQYFIEQNMIYSKDEDVIRRLVEETPFTRDFGNQSPGRLGAFIGWHIVSHYMKNHPETTLQEMMDMTNSQQFLKESYYKP